MRDLMNVSTIASLAPVAGGIYLFTHFGSVTTALAGVTIGAAVIEHGRRKRKAEQEAKAVAEQEAKASELVNQRIVELAEQHERLSSHALPRSTQVIDYTAQGNTVQRHSR